MTQIHASWHTPNTKLLFTSLFLLAVIANGQEIKRPTTETVSSTPAACVGTASGGTSMPNFYDASGEATSSNGTTLPATQAIPNKYRQAIISGWQLPSGAYSTLNLKIRSGCTSNTGNPSCRVQYSTNGGSSWSDVRVFNWPVATDTISLSPSQNLSQLRVRYCVESVYQSFPDPGSDGAILTGYDIRTEGNLGPSAPSNLNGTPATNGLSVSVTWTDTSSNESGFNIDRCTGAGCSNFVLRGSVGPNVSSFPDTTSACTIYNYRAYAFNGSGNSAFSNTVQVSTPCLPTTPSGLAVSSATTSSISLSWADSSGETSYSLERCPGGTCSNFLQVATPGANATSYTDSNLTSNAVYSYRLRASNAVGWSGYSNTVNGLTEQTLSLSTPYLTKYTYDTLGNLTKVEQQGAAATCDSNPSTGTCRVRTFEYDSLSRLTKAINPESGQITYAYDDDGNLTSKTSPKPNDQTGANTVTTNFGFDVLHRLTGKTYTGITETAVTYTFDQGTNGIGRRTGMVDASGSASWTYDEMGQVKTESRTIGTVNKSVQYSYNQDGSLATITYPSGRAITYATSGAGTTLSAIDVVNSINYATEATYTPAGALVGMKNGASGGSSGIVTANTFNSRQQPVSLTATNPSGTPVLSLTYNFNLSIANNGNVMTILNNRDHSRDQTFLYDDLNRIKRAGTPSTWGLSFGYDAWGNLLSQNVTQGSATTLSVTASKENRIADYCYDIAGNLVRQAACPADPQVVDYTYDAENRLKTAGGVTYTYDGDGERVKKSSGTLYWSGMGSDPLLETDAAGNNPTEYIFFNGKRVARRDSDNSIHYYFADHLGSADVITSATGTIEQESDYYPFGGERVVTAGPNKYKFTGKERDSETLCDYFIARHYCSAMGRFLQPDEFAGGPVDAFSSNDPYPSGPLPYADIGNPQSLNKYTYTYNNPLRYTDPAGHCVDAATAPICTLGGGGTLLCGPICGAIGGAIGIAIVGYALYEGYQTYQENRTQDAPPPPTAQSGEKSSQAGTGTEGNTSTPKEGIYEGPDAKEPDKKYVGQSGDVPNRLSQQRANGRFAAGTEVKVTEVKGGKTAREVAEHKRIQELGGVKSKPGSQTTNQRNPIGKKRKHLLKEVAPKVED